MTRAAPDARILVRSAHAQPPFLDSITLGEACQPLAERLVFETALAERLQLQDRVHTYAGFVIARVAGAEHA